MDKNLPLTEKARDRMINKINSKGKILEIGAFYNPLLEKKDYDVYYLDILNEEELKKRFHYLNEEIKNRIVPVDYILDETYNKTFKDTDMKFDYIVSSHVLEHIHDPISYLFDISTILNPNGKVCLLLPDKDFTFDYYRENSSFADWFDMYTRGEYNNLPRIFLDSEIGKVNENDYIKYWNKTNSKYPNPNVNYILNEYVKLIENTENNSFDEHCWVFTDKSFLKILSNLIKTNILPYKLIDFFPTAVYDNTFGLILELDYTVKEDLEFRQTQINDIREISKNIEKKRFEIDAKAIIEENNLIKSETKLKEKTLTELTEELKLKNTAINNLNNKLKEKNKKIDKILNSKSMKITSPLRYIANKFRK